MRDSANKVIAKQCFRNYKVSVNDKKYKKCTFTIAAKNVKQKGVKLNDFDSNGYWRLECLATGEYQ